MKKHTLLLVVSLLSLGILSAQENTLQTTNYINGAYQYGYILQSNKFVQGVNATGEPIKWTQNIRLEYGWQTDGSELWHQLYNKPRYGVGIYFGDFFNPDEIGYPTALYGFLKFPVANWGSNSFHFGFGFGLSTDWKNFDHEKNPYNNAIGELRAF